MLIRKRKNNWLFEFKTGVPFQHSCPPEAFDYAEDLALMSSKYSDIQEKITRFNDVARYTGLNINKTISMRINWKKNYAINLNNKKVKEEQSFLYLKATVNKNGGTDGRRYNEKTRIKQEWFFIPEQLIEFSLKQPRHS